MTDRSTILVVEDDPSIRSWYEEVLTSLYQLEVAPNGRVALERFDDHVGVVILDRMLPDMAGREVLSEIRSMDTSCQVVMITAVEPDFDIIDMPFDDYLTKPVRRDELYRSIDAALNRATYHELVQEFYGLVAKRATLEAEKTPEQLDDNDQYLELEARIEAIEGDLEDVMDGFDDDDFVTILRTTQQTSRAD